MMEDKTNIIDQEFIEKAKYVFENAPFVSLVGLEFGGVKDGEATVHLTMRDDLRQPHGLLHGGATATLIDTATAFAVVTKLAEGEKASTVDLNIHYLRPVVQGKTSCLAKVVKAGKRLFTVSAEVFNEEGKLIATALSTYARV